MEQTKRLYGMLSLSLLLCLLLFPVSAADLEMDAKQLWTDVRTKYFKNLPEDFKAKVVGAEIEQSIKEIPIDFIDPGKKPEVVYLYKKSIGDRIVVENVDELYRDRFANHLEVYNSYRMFLDNTIDYKVFTDMYDWTIADNRSNEVDVRLRRKNRSENTYFLMTFDKQTYLMKNAISFAKGEIQGMIHVAYTSINNYTLPQILSGFGTIDGQTRSFKLILSNFKVNVGLTEKDFVEDFE